MTAYDNMHYISALLAALIVLPFVAFVFVKLALCKFILVFFCRLTKIHERGLYDLFNEEFSLKKYKHIQEANSTSREKRSATRSSGSFLSWY